MCKYICITLFRSIIMLCGIGSIPRYVVVALAHMVSHMTHDPTLDNSPSLSFLYPTTNIIEETRCKQRIGLVVGLDL